MMTAAIEIDVWQGEIADLEVDALVIPASESLFMTSPVGHALKRRGGDDLEREAVALGPIPAGSAVVTRGGALATPYLIHAVAVGHDLVADEQRLRSAARAALALASQLGLHRLAISPLGSERGVFPPADAARLLIDELARAPESGSELTSAVIAVSSAAEAAAFRAALDASRAGTR